METDFLGNISKDECELVVSTPLCYTN